MKPRRVPSSNFVFRLPGGTEDNDLWCRRGVDADGPVICSVWQPTPEERAALAGPPAAAELDRLADAVAEAAMPALTGGVRLGHEDEDLRELVRNALHDELVADAPEPQNVELIVWGEGTPPVAVTVTDEQPGRPSTESAA